MIHEALMAITLTGVLLAGISQLLGLAMQQRHAAQQRFVARHEIANLMEEAISRPWTETTTEGLASVRPSQSSDGRLPAAQHHIRVVNESDSIRRVHIELSWLTRHSNQRQSLSLVGWRYQAQKEQP
jgi:hypothetical protein